MAAGPGLLAAGGQLLSRHRTAVLCAAALGVGLAAAWLWKSRRRSRRERRQVGVVSQLFIYPVKSFRGVALEEAECTKLGLKHGELRDRHWLVTTENGGMVTARQEPKLVLISVSCDGAFLTLKAPEMEELRIPLKLPRTNPVLNCRVHGHNVQGKDCGDETARWISAFVQSTEPYRLVHFENHMKLRNSKEEFALYHRNDQDSWDEVMIGDVELNRVMACHRCIFTTLDPDTGIINIKEPLETLRTYRLCETADKVHYKKSPLFGQYFGIGKTGRIKVGDPVYMIVS
ncbi:mitochondrial amidoxime-reducing component 1-like isoform X2 [Lissotriton helveticus]